jgi:hypothetical protein
MTHLSRPFQLVLVVFGLFAITWIVALRPHSSSTGSASSSSPPAQPAKSHDHAGAANAGSAKTHPSAPSHGAVHSHTSVTVHGADGSVHASSSSTHSDHLTKPSTATSQHGAHGPAHAGAAVAGAGAAATAHSGHSANQAGTGAAGAGSNSASAGATSGAGTSAGRGANGSKTAASGAPRMQVAVEHELAQNKTVLIVFWSPRGSEDIAVRQQVPIAAHALGRSVAVHYALPHQVTQYGKITNSVQVNQTPTILIVNKRGQATTLTGLTDAFAIEQAVGEARGSS